MSDCDVCIMGADDIENVFYSESVRRARKRYECCECRRPIAVGERYHVANGKSDGEFWTYKSCLVCDEIRRRFYCEGGWLFTLLWDDMKDHVFDQLTTSSSCFVGLSPEAKGAVMDQWRAYKKIA